VRTVTELLAMAAGTMFSIELSHQAGVPGLNAGGKLMLRFRRVYLLCCNGSLEEFESQFFFQL
jgi:hypothetical protein